MSLMKFFNEEQSDQDIGMFEADYDYRFSDNRVEIAGKDLLATDPKKHLRAYILAADDPRNFTVGYSTCCCQHYGDAGESCTAAATQDPHSGIWIIENTRSGKIEAQAWVYEDTDRDIFVFDNIEFANDQEVESYKDILGAYVNALPHRNVHMGMGYNAVTGIGAVLDAASDPVASVPQARDGTIELDTYTDYHADAGDPADRPRILKKDGRMLMDAGDSIITEHKDEHGNVYSRPSVTKESGLMFTRSVTDRYSGIISSLKKALNDRKFEGWDLSSGIPGYNKELKVRHGDEELILGIEPVQIKNGENTFLVAAELPDYMRRCTRAGSAIYDPDTDGITFLPTNGIAENGRPVISGAINWDRDEAAAKNSLYDGMTGNERQVCGKIKDCLRNLSEGNIMECRLPSEEEITGITTVMDSGVSAPDNNGKLEKVLDEMGLIEHDGDITETEPFMVIDPGRDYGMAEEPDTGSMAEKEISETDQLIR